MGVVDILTVYAGTRPQCGVASQSVKCVVVCAVQMGVFLGLVG